MLDNQIEASGGGAQDSRVRREWVKPRVHDMVAGAAELGGDLNVDGDPGFS